MTSRSTNHSPHLLSSPVHCSLSFVMFARIFALLPLALLVSASHLEARGQCNNGSVNCCNNVQSVNSCCVLVVLDYN